MAKYDVRRKCNYNQTPYEWHYIYVYDQDPLDKDIECATHPNSNMSDFVIIKVIEEV